MPAIPRFNWLKPPRLHVPGLRARRVEAVTMEVGRGDWMIVVAASADRQVRLAFGTGEAFAGSYLDLPARVGVAAQDLLTAAAPLVRRLPRQEHGLCEGTVRFTLETEKGVYAQGSGVGDLRNGTSDLEPLWTGFGALAGPMLIVLFSERGAADGVRHDIPGLVRARRLWR